MKIKVLVCTVLAMGSVCAMSHDIDVVAPSEWGTVKMRRLDNSFKLLVNDQENEVPTYMVDPLMRKMTAQQTVAFLNTGYISAKRLSDGSYTLHANGRIKGGGLAGALGGYITGEVVGYGVTMFGGYVVLYSTQKVVGLVGGREAEAIFAQNMQDRFLPGLCHVAEEVGKATGYCLGAAGAVTPV